MSLSETTYWRDDASCTKLGTKEADRLFFQSNPDDSERELKRDKRKTAIREAKDVCSSCPVRRECLGDALRHPDQAEYGIRGGLTPEERRVILRRGEAAIYAAIKSVD